VASKRRFLFDNQQETLGFLSTNFGPFEFNAHSSDYNRTLMSASAVLAAIYPPKSEDRFLPELNWRPLPVHLADKRVNPLYI